MTASEKLKEILSEIEHDRHRDGLNNGMFDEEFSEKYNVVCQRKCCEYCRYGFPQWMTFALVCIHLD